MTTHNKRHLAIDYDDLSPLPWRICWATPDGYGYRIGPPVASCATRREALARRRQEYDRVGMYPVPTEPPTSQARAAYAQRKADRARIKRVVEIARDLLREKSCGLQEARRVYCLETTT